MEHIAIKENVGILGAIAVYTSGSSPLLCGYLSWWLWSEWLRCLYWTLWTHTWDVYRKSFLL